MLSSVTPPLSTYAKPSTSQASTSRTIPTDILAIILAILSASRSESYAPLICSHVCTHWRRAIAGNPSLWSYIDTSRGEELTRLWLSHSKQVPIDVLFREHPMDYHNLMPQNSHPPQPLPTTSRTDLTIEAVKHEYHRWRSLDIALCDIHRVTQILAFLRGPSRPLHLSSLAIGPMALKTLTIHNFLYDGSHAIDSSDDIVNFPVIAAARSHFEKLNVSCDVLRIDAYPLAASPTLFSSRLTVLEVSFGGYGRYDIDVKQWEQILSQTPNLVDLRLNMLECSRDYIPPPTRADNWSLKLPSLKRLDISEGFTWLIYKLFLPKLESLTLHSFEIPGVGDDESVVSADEHPWNTIFHSFQLLREVAFSVMLWKDILVILTWLTDLPRDQLRVRLEGVWDMDMTDPLYEILLSNIRPPVEFVDCLEGGNEECDCSSEVCKSENQSSYSDNSFFSPIIGYPSSEETGSDESERSYGEDEDFSWITSAQE
ncbi:hypothetical protein FRC12_004765 [Ceratobasidium sp. 428]|nr:hypothetical protein FRC12_004765 [Ceratobasidium sp. 428]